MKRVVLIMVLMSICVFFLGADFETVNYDLSDLYYDQDIISTGIDQSFVFYFPVVDTDVVKDAQFSFFYEFTQLSGPRAMYVLMVNETPVITDFFDSQKGEINIPVSPDLLEPNTMAKISLHVTLDYSVCDQLRINENALWFRLKNESYFEYVYTKQQIETIPLFLSVMNPNRQYQLITDFSQGQFETLVGMSQYLGYLSSGVKREVSVLEDASGVSNVIDVQGEATFMSLVDDTFTIPVAMETNSALKYLSALPSASLTVLGSSINDLKHDALSFSQLGIDGFRTHVVYNSKVNYPIVLDSFGGVPENAVLNLKFSSFNMIREEGYWLNVFLNGKMLKSINLSKYDSSERSSVLIPLPARDFRAYNTFTFEMDNQKSDCDEFSLIIYDDSVISFSEQKPYENPFINDFPYSMYSDTLYVISDYSKTTAENLIQLAYEKGRVSTRFSPPTVISLDAFLSMDSPLAAYESIIFLVQPEDFYPLTGVAKLNDSFSVVDDEGELLYEAIPGDSFDVAYSFNYEGLPAIVFSSFGKETINIDQDFLQKLNKSMSDFAIFSEGGIFSFEISSEKIYIASEGSTEVEQTFWMKNRLWIVVLVVVVILFILISSYQKTSKGR